MTPFNAPSKNNLQPLKSKKHFIPIISLVLSAFLTSFTAQLKADDTSLDCTLGDANSCASVINLGGANNTLTQDTSLTDLYNFSPVINRNPSASANLISNKAIVKALSQINVTQGAKFGINFKDSVYVGNFNYSGGGYNAPALSLIFDGSYQGDSDASLKGLSFKGDVSIFQQTLNIILKNDATWVGNSKLSTEGFATPMINLNSTDSSFQGNINNYTASGGGGGNQHALSQTFNFSGNSSKGFALKGLDGTSNAKISTTRGTINLNLDNAAKAYADISVTTDGFSFLAMPIFNFTAKNKSILNGGVTVGTTTINLNFDDSEFVGTLNSNGGTTNLIANNNSKLDTIKINYGSGGTTKLTLDNSTLGTASTDDG
ncbi:hypothetical protein, partial [Helicobacter sp. 13S00477-4]|uniref:hypothetical protein n=1 Tax=Helicobacter sp. 13S00477-4 TaxID=1905759 RepID=UPI0015DBBCF1